MTEQRSPFEEEWKEALAAHYLYVVQVADHITEPTLRTVLQQVGFSEADIIRLYEQAQKQPDDDSPIPALRS